MCQCESIHIVHKKHDICVIDTNRLVNSCDEINKSCAGLHRLCINVVNVSGDLLWAYKNRMYTGNGQVDVMMVSHSTAQHNPTQHKAVKCIPMCAAKKEQYSFPVHKHRDVRAFVHALYS